MHINKYLSLLALFCSTIALHSQNPIITHMYTADPSAHVWDGRVWLYPSHDQDDAINYNSMDGHHVFSSVDMVNWTDHGQIMHTDDLPWANSGLLWAPDANRKDGVYYYYYPAQLASDGTRNVGVATSDSPAGPFTDQGPIEGADGIDPCVFIDDDGQAYLFWGSNDLRWAKMNDDMMTIQETDTIDPAEVPNFKEGAWIHKRNGIYYLSYAHSGVRKPLLYCTSTSIEGPWEYQGELMDKEQYNGWTNHHSIIEFMGEWYIFYHNTSLSVADLGADARETNFRRSVCIDKLYYNEDGTIQKVIQTDAGVDSVENDTPPFPVFEPCAVTQNGLATIQAEDYCEMFGIQQEDGSDSDGSQHIAFIENGDYIRFGTVDFGSASADSVSIRFSSKNRGGTVEIRSGSPTGDIIASVPIAALRDWSAWETISVEIEPLTGIHDLYFVFTGGTGYLFNINWIEFSGKIPIATQTIELQEGWNLISLYIDSDNRQTGTVFPNATIVKTFDAFYSSSQADFLNTLTTIEAGVGYLVYNSIDETITISGVETNGHASLQDGWNLIGVPSSTALPLSIYPDASIIKDFDSFYEEGNDLSSLTELKPGKAYFIYRK